MFEHHQQPLLSKQAFIKRLSKSTTTAILILAVSWIIGIIGYRLFEDMSWTDSILNSAMILSGMGPVDQLGTKAGKIFASFYALFSGIAFLAVIGILLAPIIHRFMHKFHLQGNPK